MDQRDSMASDTESIDDLFKDDDDDDDDDFDLTNSSIDKSNSNDPVESVSDQNIEVKAQTQNPDTCGVELSTDGSLSAGVDPAVSKPIDGETVNHAECEDEALSFASGESLFSDYDDEDEMVCDKVGYCANADNATCQTLETDKRAVELISSGAISSKEQNDNVPTSGLLSLSDAKSKKKKPRRHVPLTDMRWGFVSVTDLVAQSWCEQKLVYSYIPPTPDYEMVPLEEISPAVAAGQQIHQERDLELGDQMVIETETKEDRVALQFAQLLECIRAFIFADSGQVLRREVPILGFLPFSAKSGVGSSSRSEILVNGIIDELNFDVDAGTLKLVELKTRWSPRLPCEAQKVGHRLQVMLYQSLYNDLVEGRITKSKIALHRKLNMARALSASVVEALWWTVGDEVFPIRVGVIENDSLVSSGATSLPKITLGQVVESLLQTAKAAPRIDVLLVEYVFQMSKEVLGKEFVQYDHDWLVQHSIDAAEFWFGKRQQPKGVDIEDAWKCGMCEFAQDCQWRKMKAEEETDRESETKAA